MGAKNIKLRCFNISFPSLTHSFNSLKLHRHWFYFYFLFIEAHLLNTAIHRMMVGMEKRVRYFYSKQKNNHYATRDHRQPHL